MSQLLCLHQFSNCQIGRVTKGSAENQMCHMYILSKNKLLCLSQIINKPRPAPNLRAVLVQEHRRWYKSQTQESQQAGSPLCTQVAVHERREQRKDGSDETADESVGGQSGVGIKKVNVDEVDDGRHEDHDDLEDWSAGRRCWRWMRMDLHHSR